VLENRDLLELVLPALRADLQIVERYRFAERVPGAWPLIVHGGTEDGPFLCAGKPHRRPAQY